MIFTIMQLLICFSVEMCYTDLRLICLFLFTDRDLVHAIMEQLMINCNGQDTEVGTTDQSSVK